MCRAVGIGGRGAIAPQRFWQIRSPDYNQEGRLWPENFCFDPPNFQTFLRSWYVVQSVRAKAHSADLCAIVTLSCTWSGASVPGMHPGGDWGAHVPSDSKEFFYFPTQIFSPSDAPVGSYIKKEDDKRIFTRLFLVESLQRSLLKSWL